MKYFLLPMTVSLLMTVPIIVAAEHDHGKMHKGQPHLSKKKLSQDQQAPDTARGKGHEHGKMHKGQPGPSKKKSSSNEVVMDAETQKRHDHQKLHK